MIEHFIANLKLFILSENKISLMKTKPTKSKIVEKDYRSEGEKEIDKDVELREEDTTIAE
jgi:hypothetical protein